jgi:diguanylate cyclase (GGDEF)-like protein/PAS domain S-box-containing protein
MLQTGIDRQIAGPVMPAKVLVVDDDATNRKLLVTLITHMGHQVFEACDGREGLEMVRAKQPQLVISDILMPTMDGYEFVRRLRAQPDSSGIEVIFYTAQYHGNEAQHLAESCHVARVLLKPCAPDDILRAVDEVLNRKPVTSRAAPIDEKFDSEHLRLLTDKLAQKAEELQNAYARLSALSELNLQLASERDLRHLLDGVCSGARKLLGAKFSVLAVDGKHPGDSKFFTTSGIEVNDDLLSLPHPQVIGGPIERLCAQRKNWRARRESGDAPADIFPSEYPAANAYLAVPVCSLTRIYGWVCLADKIGADGFDAEDERLLGILAAQAGRIYENGALLREVHIHAAQLQVEMAERERANVATQQSEERFRQLAETIEDVFFILAAPSGTPIYLSPAFEKIWGRARDENDSMDWIRSVHDDDQQSVAEHLKAHAGTTAADSFEYRIWLPQGQIRWILSRQFPVLDNQGQVYRIVGVATDITLRKQAEAKIQHLNRVYAVLSAINSLIVRARSKDELYWEACRLAVKHGDFQLAWIGSVDAHSNCVIPLAWAGDCAEIAGAVLHKTSFPLDLDASISAAYRSKQPFICDNFDSVGHSVLFGSSLIERGHRSLVTLPLIVGTETVSFLVLIRREMDSFDTKEMRLLTELAGDISFALDHIDKADRLNYLAYYDSLTGLANRTLFAERIAQQIGFSKQSHGQFLVVIADTERFAAINDSLGRKKADEILVAVAGRFARTVGDLNTVARITPNHLAAIIPFTGDAEIIARRFDEKYEQWLGTPFPIEGGELKLSARVGIALYPGDGQDVDALLKNAEAALRRAKDSGTRLVFFTQELGERIAERLSLESKLRRALAQEEFSLYYQPKVDLETRKMVGMEALIRWQHPSLGMVLPTKFIPLMEETGMIVEVGAWVMHQAMSQRAAWLAQGLKVPPIAVNVSNVQLRQPDFLSVLCKALKLNEEDLADRSDQQAGIDIEVTESLLLEGGDQNISKLKSVRRLGIGIALDDFGTGYSSLSYLAKLPVNSLKIDRSFTARMLDEPSIMTLVSTMITLAHSLNLKVIAEGVELEEQAKILRLLRCDQMQGYLISEPIPAAAMSRYMTG